MARERAASIDWAAYRPTEPKFIGRRLFKNFDLAELEAFIDWGPFFQTWDLAGPYPAILKDPLVGQEAVRVLSDGKRMLRRLIEGRWLTAQAVVGLYPANSRGDDIVLWRDETRTQPALVWHGLRQQNPKAQGKPNRCLSDFVGPMGVNDHVGMFAVTAGIGVDAKTLQIQFITAVDTQGGRSSFTFTNLKENRGLSDKDFEFRMPRGVDVVTNGGRPQ